MKGNDLRNIYQKKEGKSLPSFEWYVSYLSPSKKLNMGHITNLIMDELKDLEHIIKIGKDVYQQDINGIHGPNHWQRVYKNGMLVGKSENANLRIVGLFAFLHDCKRENESIDPDHGLRAADFIKTLDLDILGISQAERETLCYACIYHNKGKVSDDPTIGSCWDADRLDLMRVGYYPDKSYLSTETAKKQDIIDYCVEQSLTH